MNKQKLIKAVAVKTGKTRILTEEIINATLEAITDELAAGGEVKLVGFGKFAIIKRAARVGRNPKTLEPVTIPAKMIPKFTPGKELNRFVCKVED